MKMPTNFLWGGSVSAHQSEGAVQTEYGKGQSIYDVLKTKGFGDFDNGIDTYHHYQEDAKLFKELGMNCYRFSISWSRIFPEGEGNINEQGLVFYDHFIDSLLEQGIEPMVCLYHFDTPLALQEKYNGWMSRKTVEAFEAYARLLMKRYQTKVKYWIPMNEQNGCPIVGMISSGIKPNDSEFQKIRVQLMHNLAIASATVVKLKKEICPEACVLGMINASPCYPKTCDPKDVLTATKIHYGFNFDLLNLLVKGTYAKTSWAMMKEKDILPDMKENDLNFLKENSVDAIGMSYYASITTDAQHAQIDVSKNTLQTFLGTATAFEQNPYLEATQWGWTIDHIGLRIILNDLYQRFELPIYVLESGIGVRETLNEKNTVEDDYRIDYFAQQIDEVRKAINLDHVDVRSFLTWAPIDILSSHGEMSKRYGFIYVDRTEAELKEMKRYKKKSFEWFSKVIKSNGEIL